MQLTSKKLSDNMGNYILPPSKEEIPWQMM